MLFFEIGGDAAPGFMTRNESDSIRVAHFCEQRDGQPVVGAAIPVLGLTGVGRLMGVIGITNPEIAERRVFLGGFFTAELLRHWLHPVDRGEEGLDSRRHVDLGQWRFGALDASRMNCSAA